MLTIYPFLKVKSPLLYTDNAGKILYPDIFHETDGWFNHKVGSIPANIPSDPKQYYIYTLYIYTH